MKRGRIKKSQIAQWEKLPAAKFIQETHISARELDSHTLFSDLYILAMA